MKKFFTLVAFLATMFCASAADVIDAEKLIEANPEATVSIGGGYDSDFTFNESLTYTDRKSKHTYQLNNVGLTDFYFRFEWNTDLKSNIRCYDPEQWVESVTIKYVVDVTKGVQLYGSDKEFDYINHRNSADFQYYEYPTPVNNEVVVKVNVPCHFFVLYCDQTNIESITVNWTDEKPVPVVETPTIECWDNPVEVGSSVSIKTATTGATIHTTIYVNDELAANQPEPYVQESEWSSQYVTLPGKAGDKVVVEAYATKTDWTDSEKATFTVEELAMSPAPSPQVTKVGSNDQWLSYVLPGEQLQISVNESTDPEGNAIPLEGAKVKYTWGYNDWDNPDNNYTSEELEADAPVIVTVPAEAPVGASFFIKAVANAEGYRKSYKQETWVQIISPVLDSPTFSLEDGATVRAGGTLTIFMPQNASEVHYTVNGGEEQVFTDYKVTIDVTEEITVEAWATGEEPFTPSEKVTVTVAPEKFEDWQDVISYNTFGLTNDDQDSNLKLYESKLTNENTGVEYEFRGGFWQRWIDNGDVNCFYFNGNNYQDFPYIRNKVAAISKATGEMAAIKTVQLDSYDDYGFFFFLSETPIEEIGSDWTSYDYTGVEPLRITVVGDNNVGSSYSDRYDTYPGKMINLDDFQEVNGTDERVFNNKYYFAIVPVQANQGYYMSRAIVGYNTDFDTSVKAVDVDALDGVNAIYNLNGVKIEAEKLTPGVYVRIVDGKATKVVVK